MIQKSIHKFWPYLLLFSLVALLFYTTGFHQNWPYWADQELTLGYNGLLMNSGFDQEYVDHPGFFSIQIIAIILKLSNLLKISDIKDITDLNNAPSILDAMGYLVYAARHLILITTFTLLAISYSIGWKIFQSQHLALLVALFIFSTNGVFYHFSLTRTEPIAFIFLILSVYFFVIYHNKKDQSLSPYLLISMVFFFCGALNKAQILIFAPFYFYWSFFFIKKNERVMAERVNGIGLKTASVISIALILYFYSKQSPGLSFILNACLIISFNALILLLAKKIKSNPTKAIIYFNLQYILAYSVCKFVSKYINQGVSIFNNIDDPMSMTRFLSATQNPTSISMQNLSDIVIQEKISSFLDFLLHPLIETFHRPTSAAIIILFCLFFLMYQRKKITKVDIYFGVYCLLSFYIVNLINKLRYVDAPQYLIFSEFFLISYAIYLIYQVKSESVKFKVLTFLVVLIFLLSLAPRAHYYHWLMRSGERPCCTASSGIKTMQHRIDMQKVDVECQAKTNGI